MGLDDAALPAYVPWKAKYAWFSRLIGNPFRTKRRRRSSMYSSASSTLPSDNSSSTRRRVVRISVVKSKCSCLSAMSTAGAGGGGIGIGGGSLPPNRNSRARSPSSLPMMSAVVSFNATISGAVNIFLPRGRKAI